MIVSWLRNEMDIPAVFTLVAMVAIFLVLCYIAGMVTYGVWILRQVYVIDKWVDLWYIIIEMNSIIAGVGFEFAI